MSDLERTEYVVWLPWTRPPLTMNQRQHWQAKRRLTRAIRDHVSTHLQAAMFQPAAHIRVQLHYVPKDRRHRDADNLVATSKPCVDGIVDAGLVPDDTPDYVTHLMPVIDAPDRDNPRLFISITVIA